MIQVSMATEKFDHIKVSSNDEGQHEVKRQETDEEKIFVT